MKSRSSSAYSGTLDRTSSESTDAERPDRPPENRQASRQCKAAL